MAGGLGTRLAKEISDRPKPMALIAGHPLLYHQIMNLKQYGITDLILVIGYMGHMIREYFTNGEDYGVHIQYFKEEQPLGTGGAFAYIADKLQETFFVIFGDIYFQMDFQRMIDFHYEKKGKITVLAHPNEHPFDSDLLIEDDEQRVTGMIKKGEDRNKEYKNLVNAGLYVAERDMITSFPYREKVDFERDIVERLIPSGQVYAYHSAEFIKDIGTPSRYKDVQEAVKRL